MLEDSLKQFQSICAWSFSDGGGRFTSVSRPNWSNLSTVDKIRIISKKIKPRIPDEIQLGFEMHYPTEVNEDSAPDIANALSENEICLAMITPGLHSLFNYGGLASMDLKERNLSLDICKQTIDLAYGSLRKAWHPDSNLAPTLVFWNGSFGYHNPFAVKEMREHLKKGIAELCKYEKGKGGELFIGIEPKGNEGHPRHIVPTVGSAICLWYELHKEYGISLDKKGTNKETGHDEMLNLDPVYSTAEEIANNMMVHSHQNSQGLSNPIELGGVQFDIDYGVSLNWPTILQARIMGESGYNRWVGHDMQPRPEDDEERGVERIRQSILSWSSCWDISKKIEMGKLLNFASKRDTISIEKEARKYIHLANIQLADMDTLYP